MSSFQFFWLIIQFLIGYNLFMPLFLYCISRFSKKNPANLPNVHEADYAIIVTAYEQAHFLPAVIKSLLQLNYSNYTIYVVADKCDISDLKLDHPKIVVLRPEQTLASNTRSHFYAINRFQHEHERLTIIDSDNLVHPEYLNELNVFFDKGYKAVQGVRAAKNLDTNYACLDAARDIYYHFYDGKLLFENGSSATLAGSGMAFTTKLYKQCLGHSDIQGAGFDKVLQFEIVKRGHRIAFAENAIVYDEKTSRSSQLVAQRARWINTWFKYFGYGFKLLAKGILGFNWNQFLFGLILLRPPLFILILASLLCFLVNLFIWPLLAIVWLVSFIVFVASFLMALKFSNTDKRIYQSLINIPNFIWYQVISLTKIRVANKLSVATQHYHKDKIDITN